MTRKKTTEEFIAQCTASGRSGFTYDNVVYHTAKTKVSITCVKHGDWMALPNDFLCGSGCPKCGYETVTAMRRKSEDQVRKEIYAVHGDRYRYKDHLGYESKNTKIDIYCNSHGWFSQAVHNHVFNKAGCPSCADEETSVRCRKDPEQFLLDAKAVHGDIYDYSDVEYTTTHSKVKILCTNEDHGYFWQEPASHLSGRGCPRCKETGYRDNKSGYLYVLTDEDITKVGITNKDPYIRCSTIAGNAGKNLKVLKHYFFEDGRIPLAIETKILKELRVNYKNPPTKFDGYRECFYDVNQAALLNRIEQLIATQTAAQAT